MDTQTIKTALISVYDKSGLDVLARALKAHNVEILSTGGTLDYLRKNGFEATSVSDYTQQEEILGGRVKTLHPKIFAGILARRNNSDDMKTLKSSGIKPIDLVVVNLYPFEETVADEETSLEEAVEQVDIGGVALLRAGSKNHRDVITLSSPEFYPAFIDMLEDPDDDDPHLTRVLAVNAFAQTSAYDMAIATYFSEQVPDDIFDDDDDDMEDPEFDDDADEAEQHECGCGHDHDECGEECGDDCCHGDEEDEDDFAPSFGKLQELRYGENPHQTAAFYAQLDTEEICVARADQLQGKELSYNNIVDLDAALEIVRAFDDKPVCCVIKHSNPCGVAKADTLKEAYVAARSCDPVSSFGGVIGFNCEVDKETADAILELFVEAVIAPSFSLEAQEAFSAKKNVRLMATGAFTPRLPQKMLKSVVGGLLVQDRDLGMVERADLKIVSKVKPTDEDLDGLMFAWTVAKFVKSNAIVYTGLNATIGIGAGQMSRIDSTNIAAVKACNPVRGAYMASDAFFPFRDNVDRAADIGIKAIIQPGGSMRDEEVIQAADEKGLILVFTGMRHFRH
ncbi:bifunctional phosphoribosylaminoimidazolecarboxamide formyltransferase/inosine monophosphate cyclohydrolase [candidate division BRC1 bacterium HGW-BRC1-1]|jgi:phosphoribosylaminoimidazolecarboxamide formyltransferase/IMP cyclohydrolase|nr:MAG: bifunctional phosphoribosylaminoimidazolecarboxamide formyltransferase/inosine monophosphate cyclohydrolase [candidate division BRC1 bacterium HGW-BRC1-1]